MLRDTKFMGSLDGQIESSKQGFKLLALHFGSTHVPKSRFIKLKVPLLPSLKERLAPGIEDRMPEEVFVRALVQERIEEFEDGEVRSLSGFYANEPSEVFVERTLDHVFPGRQSHAEVHPYVREHPEERAQLIDFTQCAIRYSEDTGKILDVGGAGNIIMRKKDGATDYLLVDAMFPITWQNWLDRAHDNFLAYLRSPDAFELKRQFINIINSTNYVRFVNHLADSLDIPERLDYFSDIDAEKQEGLKGLLKESLAAWHERRKQAVD
jgi:hypothetical protein